MYLIIYLIFSFRLLFVLFHSFPLNCLVFLYIYLYIYILLTTSLHGNPLKTESVSSSFFLLSRHFMDLLQSISANSLKHIIRHVPSVQVHLTISLFLSLTLQPRGTEVSLLPLQNCGTPYLAISVTLKTCALLKLVLRHGFLNPHLI